MADTTPVNALPMPQLADRANIETAVRPLALAIDTRVVARFGTLAARNSAITGPVAGQMCWVTETKELYVHDGSVWVSARPRCARLGAAEVRTSSTPVPSPWLLHTVESFAAYKFKYWSVWTAASDAIDVRVKFVAPSGAVWVNGGVGPHVSQGDASVALGNFTGVLNGGSVGSDYGLDGAVYTQVECEGVCITGATAGTMYSFFSHSTNTPGSPITMGAGFLEMWKIP